MAGVEMSRRFARVLLKKQADVRAVEVDPFRPFKLVVYFLGLIAYYAFLYVFAADSTPLIPKLELYQPYKEFLFAYGAILSIWMGLGMAGFIKSNKGVQKKWRESESLFKENLPT